jgi:hypothetical protein
MRNIKTNMENESNMGQFNGETHHRSSRLSESSRVTVDPKAIVEPTKSFRLEMKDRTVFIPLPASLFVRFEELVLRGRGDKQKRVKQTIFRVMQAVLEKGEEK